MNRQRNTLSLGLRSPSSVSICELNLGLQSSKGRDLSIETDYPNCTIYKRYLIFEVKVSNIHVNFKNVNSFYNTIVSIKRY